MQRGDDSLGRVVEQHRADADHDAELEAMGVAEEGLVLADRLALVVEDGPAAADPAGTRRRATFDERPGLGLDLLLDFAAETIGITEAELQLALLARLQIADMGFARDGGSERRLAQTHVASQVIDDPRRGVAQQVVHDRCRLAFRAGRTRLARSREEAIDLGLREVGDKPGERIAFHRRR